MPFRKLKGEGKSLLYAALSLKILILQNFQHLYVPYIIFKARFARRWALHSWCSRQSLKPSLRSLSSLQALHQKYFGYDACCFLVVEHREINHIEFLETPGLCGLVFMHHPDEGQRPSCLFCQNERWLGKNLLLKRSRKESLVEGLRNC